MRSQLQADGHETEEITVMKPSESIKRRSLQHETPKSSNEKVSSSRENRSVKMQEKGSPVKSWKPTRQAGSDQHAASGKFDDRNPVSPLHLVNRHKPWPSRKVNEVDEVVKYMSRVPLYLQRMEKGENVQENALNIGVLDWERLEKWTYLQKQETNRRGGDSSSGGNASLSISSTHVSSSKSSRSNDSPIVQRNQSPTMNADQSSSSGGQQTKMMKERNSGRVIGSPDSRTSQITSSVLHNHEKSRSKDTEATGIYHDKIQSTDIGTSPFGNKKLNKQLGRSSEAMKFHSHKEQNFPGNLHLIENFLQDQCLAFDSMWDHFEEGAQRRRFSYDSATGNNGILSDIIQDSHSGIFSAVDMHFSSHSLPISHSCELPSNSQISGPAYGSTSLSEVEVPVANTEGKHGKHNRFIDKCSEQSLVNSADISIQDKMKVATTPRRDLSPHRLLAAGLSRLRSSSVKKDVHRRSHSGQAVLSSTPLAEIEVPTATTHKYAKHNKFTDTFSEPFAVNISDRSGQEEAKAATGRPRRDLSPHRLLTAGLSRLRGSSMRENSSREQTKPTISLVNSDDDIVAANSKGKRSPLRRMLDPLLKSKSRMPFSGPIVRLPSHQTQEQNSSERLRIRDELKSAKGPVKSSDSSTSASTSQVNDSRSSVKDEGRLTSTRHAVLKLAWKNGLPLFMFSSDNNDILAATIGKRSISDKKDFECLYTIFTAHEVKKKGGVWMSQGNKSKKHGLLYNVVGHIRVSFPKPASYFSISDSVMREFLLFGAELIPANQKPIISPLNSELAAIIITTPNENPRRSSDLQESSEQKSSAEDKCSCCQTESLAAEQGPDNLTLPNIVAIFPKEVHGLSSDGEPPPLIKRWKSGGSCGCGGWDEGCMLKVLTERRGLTSAQACTTDESHQIELFSQGFEARLNKHTFRMDNFEEGIYTVDFRASVASLQAFATCVAILHCRKSTNLSGLQYSVEAQNLQEDTFDDYTELTSTKTEEEDPASYVPDPPPSSPVCRS